MRTKSNGSMAMEHQVLLTTLIRKNFTGKQNKRKALAVICLHVASGNDNSALDSMANFRLLFINNLTRFSKGHGASNNLQALAPRD